MGGHVFQGTSDFDHASIPRIIKPINQSLAGTGIETITVGSAATPTPGKLSGDLDLIVDQNAVMQYFDVSDPKDARKMLSDYISSKGLETAQTGINVHVKVPVNNTSHQVDLMIVDNASSVAQFHKHSIPKNSPYKGKHKHILMAMIAKDKNLMWSPWQGLFSRNQVGKKGEFITADLDEIAQNLLSPEASARDLGSVESILKKAPNPEELLQRAENDKNWTPVSEETVSEHTWFRNIMDLVK